MNRRRATWTATLAAVIYCAINAQVGLSWLMFVTATIATAIIFANWWLHYA